MGPSKRNPRSYGARARNPQSPTKGYLLAGVEDVGEGNLAKDGDDMSFTFQDVTAYIKNGTASRALLAILRATTRVFDFGYERANRLRRFRLVTRDYSKGIPIDIIAAKYDCSRSTVHRHVRIAGLEKRDRE